MNDHLHTAQPVESANNLSDLERAVEAMKSSIEESRQKIHVLEKLVERSKATITGKPETNS
jgi:nitric oxide reductase activation protein